MFVHKQDLTQTSSLTIPDKSTNVVFFSLLFFFYSHIPLLNSLLHIYKDCFRGGTHEVCLFVCLNPIKYCMYNKALFSSCGLCRTISSPYTLVGRMSWVFILANERKEKRMESRKPKKCVFVWKFLHWLESNRYTTTSEVIWGCFFTIRCVCVWW